MSETNGGAMDGRPQEYQPRHAAEQLDDELLEHLATAADEYRYAQIGREYEARYAIERRQLFSASETAENREFIGSQQMLIAKSVGRQATAKTYASSLRQQIYYVPPDGVYYHGRHRLEDRPAEEWPRRARHEAADRGPPARPGGSSPRHARPTDQETRTGLNIVVPMKGRLRHIIDEPIASRRLAPAPRRRLLLPPAEPVPDVLDPPLPPFRTRRVDRARPPGPPGEPPPQAGEKTGLWSRLRHAWYSGAAAVGAYFSHQEKGRRRRVAARVAVVIGGAILAVELASWLDQNVFDHPSPDSPQPTGPKPGSEQFFDAMKSDPMYRGERFEWGAAANTFGPAEATPKLLELIGDARANGLTVDTWGNTSSSHWGIQSVTVELSDGAEKSYYDTPHKLAILRWYAMGANLN